MQVALAGVVILIIGAVCQVIQLIVSIVQREKLKESASTREDRVAMGRR